MNKSASEGPLPKHDPLAALRQGNFVHYSIGRVFSATGNSLVQAVMAWQVYEISGNALDLGFLGLARFLPTFVTSLLGGVVADTYDRRKIMVASRVLPMVFGIALALATFGGWIGIELIFVSAMLFGISLAFEGPARQAILPALVTDEVFGNAVTVNNIFNKLGNVTGPALAGGILYVAGAGAAYTVFCVSIVLSVLPLFFLHYRHINVNGTRVTVAAVKDGLSFVWKHQILLGAMTLDLIAVIFGNAATALLPIYAKDVLHAGPAGFGLLVSAFQVGALVAAIGLVFRPQVKRTGAVLIYSIIIFGVTTMAFGASTWFILSLVLYTLIGASDQVSVVMRQTTIQMVTPDDLRGRVSAVNQVFTNGSTQIAAMEAGFMAAATGAVFAVISGGAVAVGIAVFVAWRFRDLYNYEVGHTPHRNAAPEAATESAVEPDLVSVGAASDSLPKR